ncbi:MAG: acetyl-CoA carboxylase biotin carboxyl carrier protein subunit [Hespellia sp.]|nr:acetyl-CoA carboxylase biotin carboxyl carrier protein subunit [Hespellia sp.]
MKNYTITVNGTAYDVTVEEKGAGSAATPAQAAPAAAPKAAPKAASAAAPKAAAGSIEVKAGAAGKVFKIEANVGQSVAAGDPVVIIEAMKMEIPVVAPEAGTVASIDVAVGDSIDAGAVLATLN